MYNKIIKISKSIKILLNKYFIGCFISILIYFIFLSFY